MFKIGDIVEYKGITGPVVFVCDLSLSILIGEEYPRPQQSRIVVYSHSWHEVKKSGQVQLKNRPQFPPKR